MTVFTLTSLLTLYLLPTGRRIFSLERMRKLFESLGFTSLLEAIDKAIEEDRATRELEDQWSAGRGQHSHDAMQIDAELDRALSALDENLASTQKAFGKGSPQGKAATRARQGLFPRGVRHVIHMPYAEQEVAVSTLLRRVASDPELDQALQKLQLQEFVDRIREINVRYGQALHVTEAPPFKLLQEARKTGQENLARIVFLVVAQLETSGRTSQEGQVLLEGLEEVFEQNEAIKRNNKRRRLVTDVDPETGQPLETVEDADVTEAPASETDADSPEPEETSPEVDLELPEADAA